MTKLFSRITFVTIIAALWLVFASPSLAAEPIVVNSLADGGTGCTLRRAIQAANENRPIATCNAGTDGLDTITFTPNLKDKTITLEDGSLVISDDLTIMGDVGINASHRSRIFAIDRDLEVTLQDLTLVNGFARSIGETAFLEGRGGAIVARDVRLKIVDVTFSNNRAEVSGGAIAIDGRASFLTVVGGRFYQNSADFGGAINVEYGATIHHSSFVHNHAVDQGGAIAASQLSRLTIQDSTFDRNKTAGSGGAMAGSGEWTIERVRFTGNQTTNSGGHIDITRGTLSIDDSLLRYGNQLFSDRAAIGGAIFASESAVTVANSNIHTNRVNGKGGGIYTDQGRLTLRNTELRDNSSGETGGGAYTHFSDVSVVDSAFINNRATASAGGFYLESPPSPAYFGATIFQYNSVRNFYGGGMLAVDGQISLDNVTFDTNSAKTGGGLLLGGTDVATLTGVNLISNYAREYGGGIAHHGQKMVMRDSTLRNNRAQYQGGGLFQDGVRAELTRVQIVGNEATGCRFNCDRTIDEGVGGGVYNNSSMDISDSFIDGNWGAIGGGGIANMTSHATAGLTVHRTTIANNISPRGAGIYNARGRNSTAQTGSGAFIYNSTLSNNRAPEGYPINDGGALLNSEFAVIYFTTIYNNGGNGINSVRGQVRLDHTIVAASEFANCIGNVVANTLSKATKPNLDDDGSCGVRHTGDPLLGELAQNGGHAPTHLPQPNSPIYDAGFGDCRQGTFTHDQRWAQRSGSCGLGAVFGR